MIKEAVVTGANGFIGRYILNILSNKGYKIWAVVRSDNIDYIRSIPNVEIVKCELANIKSLPDMIKIKSNDATFYHLAWEGNSGIQRGDYELQISNAKWTVDCAVTAAKLGCIKFLVSGSVTQLVYRDYLRIDGCAPEIVACYPVGRMCAEGMLKCVCTQLEIDFSWSYIANLYGENDFSANIINFLIDSYLKEKVPELTSGEQLADFMYVSDVAYALIAIAEHGKRNTSYYVGYGKPRPLKEFIEIIHKKLAPAIPSGLGRKSFSGESIDFNKIDYKKLNRHTGFTPLVSFEEGIDRIIQARGITI